MVPTQTGKPGKIGKHFPVRGNHTKYWNGNVRGIQTNVFLFIFDELCTNYSDVFSYKNITSKNTGNMLGGGYTGKVREFRQSGKVGTMVKMRIANPSPFWAFHFQERLRHI